MKKSENNTVEQKENTDAHETPAQSAKAFESRKSETAEISAKDKNQKKTKKKKKISVGKLIRNIILVIIALFLAVLFIPPLRSAVFGPMLQKSLESAMAGGYNYYTAERRDITTTLTGTASLEPYDSYNITATVTGDIVSAAFEEMDEVSKDDVLYVIDSSDIEDDIVDSRRDVADALDDYNDALEDYEDMKIVSDYSGTVRELYVEKGDNVANGAKIAYIVDNDTMLLEVPFFAANTDHIRSGTAATVTFSSTGEVLSGYVSEISNLTTQNANNSTVRNLTISVKNPGGITFGMQGYASVQGSDGVTYDCAGAGSFKYNEEETIIAEASGKVEKLYIDEGDRVSAGQLCAELSSEALDSQVKQLKKVYDNQVKALDNLLDLLEDYTITAPIAGTVVQKNYKELDTIGSNSMSSTTTLAIIYDMSKLTFDLPVDELDLGLIEVGQEVKITSDSIENAEFHGVVTKKSIVGSSSGGTTVYPVTVEIVRDDDRLLPGMNINAEIMVSSVENVVAIPVSAVKRGNRVEVVRGEIPKSENGTASQKPETELVEVELGMNDGDYIEIKSGISEGDVVAYETVDVAIDSYSAMMGAMYGGTVSMEGPDGGYGGGPGGGAGPGAGR